MFLATSVLPGDPAAVMLGTSARPDTLAALRLELGLDRPAPERYGLWLLAALRGDLGTSVTYGIPAARLVAERLLVTLPLAAAAIGLSCLVALPLGVLAATRRGRWPDALVTLASQGSVALPNFWIGLLLILLFSVELGWFPSSGFPGWAADPAGSLRSLALPAVALALPQAGVLARVTRTAMLDVLSEDFIRTARSKGLSRRRAVLRHALPNALVPVVTILGLQFSFLIAGSVLIENVFGLPGLGRLATQAFAQRDLVVLQATILFLSAMVIVVNFLADLAALALDPRSRARPAT